MQKIESQLEAWLRDYSHKFIAVKFVLIALAAIIPAGNAMAQRELGLESNYQKQSEQNYNLLNEDWVWKYCQEYNEDYADPQYTCRDYVNDGYTYLNVGFKGTTVINGVAQNPLKIADVVDILSIVLCIICK